MISNSEEDRETEPIVQYVDSPVEKFNLKNCLCDPRRWFYRYLGLFFMCFLSFGSYYCYDNPAALQDNFKNDLKISTTTFTSFYSWYSWPNVILCFFGGYLIDRVFTIQWGAIIFSLFVFAGQLVFAFGAIVDKIWLMDLGRFIFGIGGESLAVAQNTYAVSWFIGKELNLVFGLQLSISRVGSTVNMITMTPIYDAINKSGKVGHECLGYTLLIASVTCLFSLLCAVILVFLNRRRNRFIPQEPVKAGEEIKLTDALHFPVQLWLLFIICVAYYCAIFPFISLAKVFFISKYDFTPANANQVDSMVYLISAFASPFLGFLVDLTAFNAVWVIGATLATISAHVLLTFTFINPYAGMILMGISYSTLAASLWPMVALIIPKNQLGTAYGLMQSVQNLGLAVISLITGVIVDHGGYFVLEVFFLGSLCIALLAALLLYFVDTFRGGVLGIGKAKRRELMEKNNKDNE